MMFLVYTLRDIKADIFGRPVFAQNLGGLVRELQGVINSGGEDLLCKHPGDFVLYKLGTFDEQQGRFELLPVPDHVLDCASLVAAPRLPATPVSPGVPVVPTV